MTYLCLLLVGAPAAYLYWALVTLTVAGIQNIANQGRGGTIAFLIILTAAPAAVWVGCYVLVHGKFPRRSCSCLYATALVFPLILMALVTRIGMGGGL